jgi:hypothetical protein
VQARRDSGSSTLGLGYYYGANAAAGFGVFGDGVFFTAASATAREAGLALRFRCRRHTDLTTLI